MTDIALDRKTEFWPSVLSLPMPGGYGAAASTTYYAGTMQTLDSSDRPKNPATVGEKVIGVVADHVDNASGANDAKTVNFKTGVFKFALHASTPPVAGDVGKPAYASDNQTISKSAAAGSLAGLIIMIESDGVWVWVGPPATATAVVSGITATALTGTLTGTANGSLVDVAATAGSCAGGATPSAANVDSAIATAVASIVSGTNEQLKELQTTLNLLITNLTT